MTFNQVGILSYLAATLAFSFLTLLLILSWRGRPLGKMVILASSCTAVWAVLMLIYQIHYVDISGYPVWLAEFARSASWCFLLLQVGSHHVSVQSGESRRGDRIWRSSILVLLAGAFFCIFVLPIFSNIKLISSSLSADSALAGWLALQIVGMLLVEQIYRSAGPKDKWVLRYLCLGIGAIFAYDFFLYSDALLFKGVNTHLWEARGVVNSLSAPLIAISIARNPAYDIAIHVSRTMVFHSVTVLGAGVYLLVMASIGYVIRYYGGSWGGFLQVFFFCGAAIFLATIIFSENIRARTRVFLAKHFYSFKYDYREEWLKFTQALSDTDDSVPQRVIRSMASLVGSEGGLLWQRWGDGRYFAIASWRMIEPQGTHADDFRSLSKFLESCNWVIDIDEYLEYPSHYEGLDLPDWLIKIPDAWLILPLVFKHELKAFVLLRRSLVRTEINWEDRDLLKMAGQQAAIYLAQYLADQALVEARQFDAFNRLSAYIVHDLKNILAQQSLLVSNAEKHRNKPEFIEDVIRTVENSVSRMKRLMDQLRSGLRGGDVGKVNLVDLLGVVVAKKSLTLPVPVFKAPMSSIMVQADREQLANVFGHIVQNAQEATPKFGTIELSVSVTNGRALVFVNDTGCGMDEDFIRSKLFKPFESTKGLTGMGIGLFESREYIRAIGGDISVNSSPGKGTMFQVNLPALDVRSLGVKPDSLETSL